MDRMDKTMDKSLFFLTLELLFRGHMVLLGNKVHLG